MRSCNSSEGQLSRLMAWLYVQEIQEAPKVVISAWGLMKMTAHRKLVHDLQCVVKGLNMKLLFLGKWCDYKISWLTAWWFLPSRYWFWLILYIIISAYFFWPLSTFHFSWHFFFIVQHIACIVLFTVFFFSFERDTRYWIYVLCSFYYHDIKWVVIDCSYWHNFNLLYSIFFQIRLSDLIAARILRFTDFDTLIYTCAPEFGFMEKAVCCFFVLFCFVLSFSTGMIIFCS